MRSDGGAAEGAQLYEKLANELAWPMIVRGVRMALDAQVRRLLLGENPGMFEKHPEELEAVTELSFHIHLLLYD